MQVPLPWQWVWRMMKVAVASRCFAVRQWQQTRDEEEALDPGWLLPQVCWEGAAEGRETCGHNCDGGPKDGNPHLVGTFCLGLESAKSPKGVCAFPRKLCLVMGTSFKER